jgi:hypothetical protein
MEKSKWIDEKEVARITGRALATLRNDRSRGRGIPYAKIGRSVRYNEEDVYAFMLAKTIKTESY